MSAGPFFCLARKVSGPRGYKFTWRAGWFVSYQHSAPEGKRLAVVIGITGGIATGKSTVLGIFAELGALTVSADSVARDVLARATPAYDEAVKHFGEGILAPNGEIDRGALAEIIFRDADARRALEEITHPRIMREVQDRIDEFRRHPPGPRAVMAVEIPLLMECGLEGVVDEVLLVAAEQETQIGRLTSRSGISPEQAVRRIQAQMPLEEKISRADRVVWNDGSLEALERSVRCVWEDILRREQ